MVFNSTVLRGIVVFLLAVLFGSVCALTIEQQFQQLRSDYVLTKELLKNSIIRLEKQHAQLEVLGLDVQQQTLLVEVFERRINQLEASPAKEQEKIAEPLSKVQQQDDAENDPLINSSSTKSNSIPNGVIDFIQENKESAEPADAASIILAGRSVVRMDYNSVTLNKVPSSCSDPNHCKEWEKRRIKPMSGDEM